MSSQHRFSSTAGPTEAHLRILSTTDLHMQLMPYDYIADQPASGYGLVLAGSLIERLRGEASNALLFDVGDALEGSPVDAALADHLPDAGHPMLAAFATLGVDAATLGNHDFNHGLPPLERCLKAASVPLTLANIVRRRGSTPLEDVPFLPPTLMLERNVLCGDGQARPIKVGLIGVAPPQTLDWDGDKIGTLLEARDIVETVAAWAPEVRRQGADIVAVLSHSGLSSAEATPYMEHASVPVAAVPDVDVVLAGHAHQRFPHPEFRVAPGAEHVVDANVGTVHDTPTVMSGYWGTHVGCVDLRLRLGEHGWTVAGRDVGLHRVGAEEPHEGLVATTAAHHAATLRAVRRVVGTTSVRLDTYFAQIADVPAIQLVNAAKQLAVEQALVGSDYADLPVLSSTAPLRAGGLQGARHYTDIAAGPMCMRHVVDLYVYPNSLVALPITGAELRLWLERSANAFRTLESGRKRQPLLEPAHPSYAFDVVQGVTYRFDLSVPPYYALDGTPTGEPGRVRDLAFHGQPVADQDMFILATNSYRLGHGSNFPVPARGAAPLAPQRSVRECVLSFVQNGGAEGPLPAPGWGFVSMPKTTALLQTGSGAVDASVPGADAPGGPVLQFQGSDHDGYRYYDLDLERAHVLGPILAQLSS